jgi:LIVCS family branched-chain amino acid:cation transporter
MSDHSLGKKEYIAIASMLFGLFFGAGNLIFPVYMGQMAGRNILPASIGFLVTGVGLPLLGIVAMGISRSEGLLDMADRVSHRYSLVFTSLLYLTIGPFFAIPRTATVSFSVGIEQYLGGSGNARLYLALFSLAFFAVVLFFSLRPSGILTWVGKILNPAFLVFLGILIIAALIHPMGAVSSVEPSGAYAGSSFFTGFMEGYNTMDALASLAFGIIVINVIRDLGVTKPEQIAADTVKSGIFSMTLMAVIYVAIIIMGAQSRGIMNVSGNGGIALASIAGHYFGKAGAVLLALLITFACLKTAIGLITSCSTTFSEMMDGRIGYKPLAVFFCILSFAIANLGLNKIIAYSIPVLMLLYPLVITLILLSLFGRFFGYSGHVFRCVTFFTLAAAVLDFVNALPTGAKSALHADGLLGFAGAHVPLFALGLGWVVPAAAGLVLGLVIRAFAGKNPQK